MFPYEGIFLLEHVLGRDGEPCQVFWAAIVPDRIVTDALHQFPVVGNMVIGVGNQCPEFIVLNRAQFARRHPFLSPQPAQCHKITESHTVSALTFWFISLLITDVDYTVSFAGYQQW